MGRWIPSSSSPSLLLKRIQRASHSPLHLPTHTPSLLNSPQQLRPASRPLFRLWGLRFLSANPCPSAEEEDFGRGVADFERSYGLGGGDLVVEEEEERGKIPVKAYFLSTSIDLKSMQAENWSNVVPFTSRSSNYIALRYYDFPPELVFGCSDEIGVKENWSCCRYVVVFQYGSVILFNIEENEVDSYLDIVRRHTSGLLLSEMKRDDYAVKEKPLMMEEMQGGPDYIVLKSLDMDAMRIIGSVLGQSIALDYFVSQVDGVLEVFTDINRGMEETGNFTMRRKKLFQLVGKANSNLADVIIKVGIFDRSEIAWKDAKYAQILEYLREEYEVTQRLGNLDFKLKFVEHNIHFLQEVLQNRKSDLLVWCMIILLGIQDVVMIFEIIHDTTTALPS